MMPDDYYAIPPPVMMRPLGDQGALTRICWTLAEVLRELQALSHREESPEDSVVARMEREYQLFLAREKEAWLQYKIPLRPPKTKVVMLPGANLFVDSPPSMSIGHCVAEDFEMSAGLAIDFRELFGNVNYLLSLGLKVGQVAVLPVQQNDGTFRYALYIITKEKSRGTRPTRENFEAAIVSLRDVCTALGIKQLGLPKIGAGLDKLPWEFSLEVLERVFANSKTEVFIFEGTNDFTRRNFHKTTTSPASSSLDDEFPPLAKTSQAEPLVQKRQSISLIDSVPQIGKQNNLQKCSVVSAASPSHQKNKKKSPTRRWETDMAKQQARLEQVARPAADPGPGGAPSEAAKITAGLGGPAGRTPETCNKAGVPSRASSPTSSSASKGETTFIQSTYPEEETNFSLEANSPGGDGKKESMSLAKFFADLEGGREAESLRESFAGGGSLHQLPPLDSNHRPPRQTPNVKVTVGVSHIPEVSPLSPLEPSEQSNPAPPLAPDAPSSVDLASELSGMRRSIDALAEKVSVGLRGTVPVNIRRPQPRKEAGPVRNLSKQPAPSAPSPKIAAPSPSNSTSINYRRNSKNTNNKSLPKNT
ncbi:uncharacterized protein LOC132204976 [Neocloeon triangulifer]|uniref:uncharacterized protein LOC132204976 n=1 Tax=Neocloeon triangulifer TaxID=2078957 RepID=UPI00286EF7A1|nr:uncharacterized protein LOC132204976 [Neocloeon triangulifer]